ncbi:MAG: hypothetical protein GC151_17565 [Betaproteobacteria bacterium]|nr:hypothetical protein [Betaproteobacteria bacterium]
MIPVAPVVVRFRKRGRDTPPCLHDVSFPPSASGSLHECGRDFKASGRAPETAGWAYQPTVKRIRKAYHARMRRLLSLLILALAATVVEAAERLPALNVDITETSVSGLSSGAFMAVQFHLAHASIVRGVGIVAGGPWFCAHGSAERATGECMQARPATEPLLAAARRAARKGEIDPLNALARSRVWLYSGYNDGVVRQSVVDALDAFYGSLVPVDAIFYRADLRSGHAIVSDEVTAHCDVTAEPFLVDCGYDMAGSMLQFIYGRLVVPGATLHGRLVRFDQTEFVKGWAREAGMASEGYAYVPAACANGERCRLHIALHGCEQSAESVGEAFVRNAGFNRWADANRIVVLYPQARATWGFPWNPAGCWDWWGYTGSAYATRLGPQVAALRAMADRIASGATAAGEPGDAVGVPSDPVVVDVGSRAAALAWVPGGLDGEVAVSASGPSGETLTRETAAAGGSITLSPLTPGARYRVTVTTDRGGTELALTTPAAPPPCDPWYASNVDHARAGRARVVWGRAYAVGTGDDLGWWNGFTMTLLHRVPEGFARGSCP